MSSPTPTPDAFSDAGRLAGSTVDVVVVGGGAAGLNGALMLARSRRSVVVVDGGNPRNAPAEAVHGLFAHDGTPPAELLRRGRAEVRDYGGIVVRDEVSAVRPAPFSAEGDPRFDVVLAGGARLRARRILVATGLRDELPEIPGLVEHWGRGVVHCPYCHGWEVRDEPIAVLATGPASIHHVLLFRQLSDDIVYFTRGTDLDDDTRDRFAARGVRVVETPVAAIESGSEGITGVRLTDGTVVARRVVAVATRMIARTDGVDGLGLTLVDHPGGMGRGFATGAAGTTSVPGVWVAGNATDLAAQVGASAAAGALAGAHINADLAVADTDAALAASRVPPFSPSAEGVVSELVLGERRHGLEPV
ncbi:MULTISPECIES: NAD(P)/FAD-dependent oxidoreductase [Pseudonocardia]|uniref:Thioredoxin reductase n=2 Tax=Pseudonocardia TaxID=1847 RepID=A0A1Y2MLX9_PSEAH|nr:MULTISPECIES: NAD(P)/FAD-dependent oxidoreductase [Pseudonocardia]OSY36264.1 Thioredoxin reductase [Pseudonocardia autotrophica]TDN73072.1 thioredoxin reductase [Pseudonocardia autotrophica]BBG03789.1 oxidoreductase [Pseudonocardia autotrophica]GEC26603.1 oxidoreductase [Pseudonocardia saturnea]